MISNEEVEMLEAGAALLIGSVSRDGVPRAARAWGIRFLDDGRVRVVAAADDVTLANLRDGPVAITGADVVTLRSIQLKGRVVKVEPPSEDDLELSATHVERMFTGIWETDRTPLELQERLLPPQMVVIELDPTASFDQTPGPRAGTELGGSS